MQPWFDTHVHLDRYSTAERASLLERAGEAEVEVIAVAVDMASSRALMALGGGGAKVIGVHPKYSGKPFEVELREFAAQPGVVGIGECGFDAEGPALEVQEAAFRAQCAIARSAGLALVLHVDGPGSWEALLVNRDALDGLRVIRHYFTGDAAEAAWHAAGGHYLSFGNPLRRDPGLREIARGYPPELLLIETDSYPLPGRNTEPAHVARVGETLALVREWTFAEAREQLARNTAAAFRRRG